MNLNNFPLLYHYKPNCFINLTKLETIEPTNYDPNKYWYHINGHIVTVPKEAHEELLKILNNTFEKEE